jgi:hypothetical protein
LKVNDFLYYSTLDMRSHLSFEWVFKMPTKQQAIEILQRIGHNIAANALENWRNTNGNNGGWDGWLRGAFPTLVGIIWPRGIHN